MFYDSNSFKVLEAGVQMAWMQQQINTQNIANSETPGYKSKSLSFESILKDTQDSSGARQKEIASIQGTIHTSDNVSTRPDGNNVDGEAEAIALYKAYAQYSAILSKISSEFDKYNAVLGANM
jgi:flagellar basal-body rod protein FlgB